MNKRPDVIPPIFPSEPVNLTKSALVIHFEGAPKLLAMTIHAARDYLGDVLEEGAESYSVWEVFTDGTEANDVTIRFANDWAGDLGYGDGDDPDEFLKPFTGFVLAHLRDELIAEYRQAEERAHG